MSNDALVSSGGSSQAHAWKGLPDSLPSSFARVRRELIERHAGGVRGGYVAWIGVPQLPLLPCTLRPA